MITTATYVYVALSVEDLNFTISTLQVSVFNGTDEACDLDSLCVIKKKFSSMAFSAYHRRRMVC